MQFRQMIRKMEKKVIKLIFKCTEQETREKKDPVLTEEDSEKDDFRQFLSDLWLEQQEQMG